MTRSNLDLTGRIAAVMGATSGLGRAIAIGLARAGADVVPAGRRPELIEEVCSEIEASGRSTLRTTADATSRRSIDRLRDTVLNEFGRVDILVNAAGKTFRKATHEVSEAEWNDLMDLNGTGTLRACQSFYGTLKASGKGRVINIASIGSYLGLLEVTAYATSKAAVLALTRSLAVEWARDGITVNAIAPGVFPTELNATLLEGTPRGQECLLRTPMRRFGRSDELVGAAVLLASDAASFITGECIAVDGGFLASGVNQ